MILMHTTLFKQTKAKQALTPQSQQSQFRAQIWDRPHQVPSELQLFLKMNLRLKVNFKIKFWLLARPQCPNFFQLGIYLQLQLIHVFQLYMMCSMQVFIKYIAGIGVLTKKKRTRIFKHTTSAYLGDNWGGDRGWK